MNTTDDNTTSTAATALRWLPALAAALIVMTGLSACREEKKEIIDGKLDFERVPTMKTVNVETLISDSGIVRYRIVSPLWLMFEEARDPYWHFPRGIKLERFNDLHQKDANISCDTATYYKERGLWRLDGNVSITNTREEKFMTRQLFWNEKTHEVYSDSFIHIERADRILEGYGFKSNDRLTHYTINQVSGIFPVDGLKSSATDAIDTVAPATPGSDNPAPTPDNNPQ